MRKLKLRDKATKQPKTGSSEPTISTGKRTTKALSVACSGSPDSACCTIPRCDIRGTHWHPLLSSNVSAVAYHRPTNCLFVKFRHGSAVYCYEDVPLETLLALLVAPSAGKFVNAEIKGKYSFVRIPDTEACQCCGAYWPCDCEIGEMGVELVYDERGRVTGGGHGCRTHGQEF